MHRPPSCFIAALLTLASAIAGCSASTPVCSLFSPYQATNFKGSTIAGLFEACVDISAKADQNQAWDLQTLQLIVAGECYNAVESVSFAGEQYEPTVIKFDDKRILGVKISAQTPLAMHKQLSKEAATLCIRLSSPCLTADRLNNMVVYEPVGAIHDDQAEPPCAMGTLFSSHVLEATPTTASTPLQTSSSSFSRRLQHPQAFRHPARRALKAGMCVPNLQCGTDKAGQDTLEFMATAFPDAMPIGNPSIAFEVVDPQSFTVNDCCVRCREQTTARCNSFIVRDGTCFLKNYPLSAYPVKNTGVGCPPRVDPLVLVADVEADVTIIGAGCACES